MILYCDANIPGVEYLKGDITISSFYPSDVTGPDASTYRLTLTQADALFIRTVTKITPADFPELANPDNKIRFIATASAGKDHVDEPWLNSLGIHFAHAPGCNATAVAEYVVSALLLWLDGQRLSVRPDIDHVSGLIQESPNYSHHQPVVGLIGAGYTGSATATLLKALGCKVLQFDPPKERLDPTFRSCSLEELKQAEIWSLHVPLTTTGKDATYHLVNSTWLENAKVQLVIQASRGGVLDESIWQHHDVPDLICDVWEGEPLLSLLTLEHAYLATPHIAGYSVEAKARAVEQIVMAFSSFFGDAVRLSCEKSEAFMTHKVLHEVPSSKPLLQSEFHQQHPVSPDQIPESLGQAVERLHPIKSYDAELRNAIHASQNNIAGAFSKVRNQHPLRHEFSAISCPKSWHDHFPELSRMGIGKISP